MSDRQLRQAQAAGIEIGAHTLTHPFLSRLDARAAGQELVDGQAALQDRLGAPVQTLAYPYGDLNDSVARAARSLYRAACTVELNTARQSGDRWRLPRLDMYYWRDPRAFDLFGTARGQAYLTLRRLGRWGRRVVRGKK
jgi:peptidoglycan/xylan/chitin deacetylase (PgdA/CDA1 family)